MYLTLLSCLIIALFFFIYNNPKLLSIWVPPLLAPFILQCPLEGPHSKWDPVMVLIGMLSILIHPGSINLLRHGSVLIIPTNIMQKLLIRPHKGDSQTVFPQLLLLWGKVFSGLSWSLCSFSSSIIQSQFEMNHWLPWQQIERDFQAFIIYIEYNRSAFTDQSKFLFYVGH